MENQDNLKRPLCFIAAVFIAVSMAGLALVPRPLPDYRTWEDQVVTLTGQVVGKEIKNSGGRETMMVTIADVSSLPSGELHQAIVESAPIGGLKPPLLPAEPPLVGGRVLCYLATDSVVPYLGSRVSVQGRLSGFPRATNPGQFSSAEYYQILKTDFRIYESTVTAVGRSYSRYREALYGVKTVLGQTLERFFEAEDASIMRTMLLGESGQTDAEIKKLYQRNGIVHILAISGLHISLIGMGIYRLLRKLAVPIPIVVLLAIAVMYSYGVMTNMGTSSIRAIMMFGLRLVAQLLGRTYDLLTALAAAAVLLLLEQPLYLNHSGFLFSFLAVLSIGLFIPALNGPPPKKDPGKQSNIPSKNLSKSNKNLSTPYNNSSISNHNSIKSSRYPNQSNRSLIQSAGQSIVHCKRKKLHPQTASLLCKAAGALSSGVGLSAVTLPVSLSFYYQFPLYSILLNLLVIPLMSLVMLTGIITMTVGMVLPVAGKITSVVPTVILALYEYICRLCDSLPGSNLILGKPEVWQLAVYGMILFFLTVDRKSVV
jgi:competence protein ComEC